MKRVVLIVGAVLGVAAASVDSMLEATSDGLPNELFTERDRVTRSDDPPDGPRPMAHLQDEFGKARGGAARPWTKRVGRLETKPMCNWM